MARYRTRPIHDYLQSQMDEKGYGTLQEASDAIGVPVSTLGSIADTKGKNKILEAHKKAAKGFGVPLKEWIDNFTEDS